jgi:hypothetical protein
MGKSKFVPAGSVLRENAISISPLEDHFNEVNIRMTLDCILCRVLDVFAAKPKITYDEIISGYNYSILLNTYTTAHPNSDSVNKITITIPRDSIINDARSSSFTVSITVQSVHTAQLMIKFTVKPHCCFVTYDDNDFLTVCTALKQINEKVYYKLEELINFVDNLGDTVHTSYNKRTMQDEIPVQIKLNSLYEISRMWIPIIISRYLEDMIVCSPSCTKFTLVGNTDTVIIEMKDVHKDVISYFQSNPAVFITIHKNNSPDKCRIRSAMIANFGMSDAAGSVWWDEEAINTAVPEYASVLGDIRSALDILRRRTLCMCGLSYNI